jgi:hypothetical protein
MLQSWDHNGAYGYWIVQADSSASAVSTFDNSLLQESASRLQRLEQLHHDERKRLTDYQSATNETGSCNIALNTNWMRRTGWAETFADADQKLLVQLPQIPRNTEKDLALRVYNGVPMHSRREDESKLSYLVTALDQVFDQCEDTVRHTDVSIRCLLRSSYPDRTYKAPFELVGRKATTEGYRRQFKKALCFCVHFWRLNTAARQNLLQRSLTDTQSQSLKEMWCDDAWSVMPEVQGKEPHGNGTKSEPTSPFKPGWLSEDEFDDIRSTYTDDNSNKESDGSEVATQTSPEFGDLSKKDGASLLRSNRLDRRRSTNVPPVPALTREAGDVQSLKDVTSAEWPIALEDLLFRFVKFLSTEEYEDGKPSSTLLIYFSGILGISQDGSTFERAKNYTLKLSALIYCIRMIILEATLPQFAHAGSGWKARPRYRQIDLLNKVCRRSLCLGSLALINELLSLQDYRCVISRSNSPSFRVTWSEDGQIVSWNNHHLSMAQFQQIGQDSLQATSVVCSQLMYGWSPEVNLSAISDNLSCTAARYSFVTASANGLSKSYLELSRRASLATVDGLMTDDDWDHQAVHRYLDRYTELTASLMLLTLLLGGQAPRGTELSALEHCNGPSTSRGVCVYARKMALVYRHAKS